MGTDDTLGTTPEQEAQDEQWRLGSVMAKRLSNGRVLTITPMTFGKYRLNLGNRFSDNCIDDCW